MSAAKAKTAGMRTTGQVVLWWVERLELNRSVSASYRRTMASLMRCHVIPALGQLTLKRLNRAEVDDRLVWPMQQTHSPHTVHKAVQGLLKALALAVRQERIEANPLAGVGFKDFWSGKLPPKAAGLLPVDVPTLVPGLCVAFDKTPVAGMLALMMLAHGTRIGETCQARWQHISLTERVWIIPSQNTKTRQELVVPLTPQACALLTRYRELQHPSRHGSPWVFATQGGGALSATQASKLFAELSGRQWTSHDLRKLARTVWAEIGVDYLVGEMLLNHSMGMLASTYIRTTADHLRREALTRWHEWLDARGFAEAHGLKNDETGITTEAA
ncbi:MAG: site-specific integrase [Pseudomonas sp.]|nr:site-specific integrase [Pseudomonas sp.]